MWVYTKTLSLFIELDLSRISFPGDNSTPKDSFNSSNISKTLSNETSESQVDEESVLEQVLDMIDPGKDIENNMFNCDGRVVSTLCYDINRKGNASAYTLWARRYRLVWETFFLYISGTFSILSFRRCIIKIYGWIYDVRMLSTWKHFAAFYRLIKLLRYRSKIFRIYYWRRYW